VIKEQTNLLLKKPLKKGLLKCCGVGGVYLDSANASLDINFSPLIKII
jgi:hypothetical protein